MFQNGVSFDECQLREPALQTPSLFIPSTLRMREFSVSTLPHPLLPCSAPAFFFLPRWIYYYLLQGKNMRLVFRSRIGSCEKLLILRDIIESALITFSFSERQLKICWPLSFFLKKRKTIQKLWSRDNLIISVCHKHVTGITVICLPSRLSRDCHVSRAENQNCNMAAGLGLAEVILDLFSDFSVNKAIEIKKITLFWWQKSEKGLKTNAFER